MQKQRRQTSPSRTSSAEWGSSPALATGTSFTAPGTCCSLSWGRWVSSQRFFSGKAKFHEACPAGTWLKRNTLVKSFQMCSCIWFGWQTSAESIWDKQLCRSWSKTPRSTPWMRAKARPPPTGKLLRRNKLEYELFYCPYRIGIACVWSSARKTSGACNRHAYNLGRVATIVNYYECGISKHLYITFHGNLVLPFYLLRTVLPRRTSGAAPTVADCYGFFSKQSGALNCVLL